MNNLIFMILILPLILLGNPDIDSLKTDVEKSLGAARVKKLNTLSKKYLSVDIDSALFYAKKALTIAKLYENDTLAATPAYLVGNAYILKEEYENALEFTEFSMKTFKKNGKRENFLKSLSNMAVISHNISKYNDALTYYKIMLKNSLFLEDKSWSANAFDGLGTVHYFLGDYDSALHYLNSSLSSYTYMEEEDIKSRLYYGMSAVYMSKAQYDFALDYLLKSITIAERTMEYEYLALSNHAIGIIYEKLKNYTSAIKYHKIALKFAESVNDKYLIGYFYNHSGELYLQLSKNDSALILAQKAYVLQKSIKNKEGITRSLNLIGNINLKEFKYKKALEYFHEALSILKNIDIIHRKTKLRHHLGVTYTKIEKYKVALNYLLKSLEDARKIGALDLVQDNLNALSSYYATLNDYKKAYQYLCEFKNLNDSLFTTNSHNIAEMQMRYETGKREKENELLKNKIYIQNLELEKSSLQKWLSSLSLIIVSIIGFFSYHRYKVKKKANLLLKDKIHDALKTQKEQQEIIFHQANLSSLGELAAGMAHEINQPLQAIKLSTEALELEIRDIKTEKSIILENIVEIYQGIERIRNIINHVRVFASQQKNHIDEYFKTSTVIQNALSLVGKQYLKQGISVQLKLNTRLNQVKGNPYKFEQVVFNLLSNAKDALLEKESKADQTFKKEICVKTFQKEHDIVMEVQDNGIGMRMDEKNNIFDPFYTTKNLGVGTGLGLSIVYGIVNEMNGKIQFESDYNIGTSVQVSIPKAIKK